MLFCKAKCEKCRGTGVKEHESYHSGVDFFFCGLELLLPIVTIVFPLYLLARLGAFSLLELLQYWIIIGGVCLFSMLVSLFFLPRYLKGIVFTRCSTCSGTGVAQNAKDNRDK